MTAGVKFIGQGYAGVRRRQERSGDVEAVVVLVLAGIESTSCFLVVFLNPFSFNIPKSSQQRHKIGVRPAGGK
jgi:hypothetical protein